MNNRDLETLPGFNTTTGGAGLNRENDFDPANPFLNYQFKGKLRSNPLYLPFRMTDNFRSVTGIGIRIQYASAPLRVQDYGYTGNAPLNTQPDMERSAPWYRRIFE